MDSRERRPQTEYVRWEKFMRVVILTGVECNEEHGKKHKNAREVEHG